MALVSNVYNGSIYHKVSNTKPLVRNKKSKKKRCTQSSQQMSICKRILGYAVKDGVSVYTLLAECLIKSGYKKSTPEQSDKEFSKEHWKKLIVASPKQEKSTYSETKQQSPNDFIKSAEFLQSFDWRKLRMEALKKYGARCQCCGASPATGAVMNVDHIKPRKTHPDLALSLDNLQILCSDCNHGKGNWDSTDWRRSI